jgi:PAS domain S-box-containing protein
MNWTTICWSATAAACLTLAALHFFVWIRQRDVWAHLAFSSSAAGAAAIALFELGIMNSQTTQQIGSLVRGIQVPLLVMTASLVAFVRLYLNAGNPWLGWAAAGMRALAMVIGFLHDPNLNYNRITGLKQVSLLGSHVSVAVGERSNWTLVGNATSILVIAFLVSAMVTVWRRGDRTRSVVLCGSMIAFFTVSASHVVLVQQRVFDMPYMIGVSYLGVILAMGFELSSQVIRAATLTHRLQLNEAALRVSEERLDLAAAAAGLGSWSWDMVGDDMRLSEAAGRLFGLSASAPIKPAELLGVVHADDRGTLLHAFANSMNGNGDYQCDFRVRSDGLPVRWIAARGRVTFDHGKPVCMNAVCGDITLRRRAEAEAQQQRNELAHLSRVATVGELSGSLAHELNQPLTAILSNAEAAQRLLERNPPDLDEIREILKDIVDDDSRAGEIIRRLRVLLKKGELQRHDVDVNETVREVLRLIQSDLLNHHVTVQADLKAGLPAVSADHVQVQQVLLNLFVNACDAMAQSERSDRRLTVRTEFDGAQVVVRVADRGHGIPPDQLEEVFAPFFTTKNHGMGLGLAVCRTIIAAHGGRLWATNNSDGGACFHVALPLATKEKTN